MFKDSNILLFLLAIIPGLIYAYTIYINAPRRSLRLRLSLSYLLYGMISVFFVFLIQFIFPHWLDYIEIVGYNLIEAKNGTTLLEPIPSNLAIFMRNYVQVGFTEEFWKGMTFLLITVLRLKVIREKDKPYAIMFYVMMVSLGFALVENVHYGWKAYIRMVNNIPGTPLPETVLIIRSVTSIITHMICGLIMGFFFTLGFRDIHGYSIKQTALTVWSKNHKKLKAIIFSTIGIILASLFHGTYDLLLDINVNWITVAELLIIGFIVTYTMSKELTDKTLT